MRTVGFCAVQAATWAFTASSDGPLVQNWTSTGLSGSTLALLWALPGAPHAAASTGRPATVEAPSKDLLFIYTPPAGDKTDKKDKRCAASKRSGSSPGTWVPPSSIHTFRCG